MSDETVNERLLRFAFWAIHEHRQNECCDLDGASIQGMMQRYGILVERPVTEPCGDQCACADVGETGEWTCYFLADDVVAAEAALREEGGKG